MIRLILLLIAFIFINNCSLNENSRIWTENDNDLSTKPNIKKVFEKDELIEIEFNQDLKLDLSKIKTKKKIIENFNNPGSQSFSGELNKFATYKFSKLEEINQLNFKPIFLPNGLIFFDKKGSIIRYDENQKVLWKKNYYSKSEKNYIQS